MHCNMADCKDLPLGRLDMRLSNDATGSGIGKDYFCFRCGIKGHFARGRPEQTEVERQARGVDPLAQLALTARGSSASPVARSVPQFTAARRKPPQRSFCRTQPQ
jgi:hypothetical protein